MLKRVIVVFSLILFSASAWVKQHAVAMPDKFGAEVAMAVLDDGGNAIDATIAAAFALAVTFPEAGNIGGGGFMLVYHNNQSAFLDYRETAPAKAHKEMYLDEKGDVIPKSSLLGGLAVGVPGTVDGMWQAHQKYGTKSWKELILPAIKLASEGFVIDNDLASGITDFQQWTAEFALQHPNRINFNQYFSTAKEGVLFKQPELAKTLAIIAEKGREGFYQGEVAKLIVKQMEKSDGIISEQDLKEYQSVWRTPLQEKWRGYQVLSAPPPSSGGIAVIQLLKMKSFLDDAFEGVELNSAQYIHLTAEMEKRVYADRAEYLGDPDFFSVPTEKLLNNEYIKNRALEVNSKSISKTETVKPGLNESMDTTHFSVIDQWGNAVSNTYTLNASFGNGLVVEGAGFLLNNEMDDFSAKPGVPNLYGVVGGEANAIAPGKRMLSSMSPTILLENNTVKMVVGTPGGSTIITSVYQAIVNAIDFKLSLFDAIHTPRFHHQLLPKDLITFHHDLNEDIQSQLKAKGYRLRPVSYLGYVQALLLGEKGLEAVSDGRGRGVALTSKLKNQEKAK